MDMSFITPQIVLVVLIVREAVFDRDVLTFDIAGLFQTPTERGKEVWVVAGRPAAEESDHRHRGLLRARHERPRGCCAAQQRSLRILVVRCSLPCDPPAGGHSCNGGIIPRFHRAVSN